MIWIILWLIAGVLDAGFILGYEVNRWPGLKPMTPWYIFVILVGPVGFLPTAATYNFKNFRLLPLSNEERKAAHRERYGFEEDEW